MEGSGSAPGPRGPERALAIGRAVDRAVVRVVERFVLRVRLWLESREPTFRGFFLPALLAAFVVFSRAPVSNYIFDEQEALLANPYLAGRDVGWLEVFRRDFWGLPPERTIGSYRPLPNLIWRALYFPVLHPVAPWLLDFANIFFHAMTAAGVASLAFSVTRSKQVGWLSGSSFLLCGVLTEAVTGVVGLADVLAGLGVVLALLSLRARLVVMPLLVFLSLCFGFLAKESVLAAIPLVALAAFLLAPALHPERPLGVVRGLCAGLAAVGALVAYTYFRRTMFPVVAPEALRGVPVDGAVIERGLHAFLAWFQQPKLPSDPMNNPLIEADFLHRAAGGLRVYLRGLVQLFVPWSLSGDYSFPQEPVPETPFGFETLLGAAAFVLPLATGAWLALQRGTRADPTRALLALGLLWVPLAYLPHSNLLALLPTVRADRFWYLPALGSALLLGVLLRRLLAERRTLAVAFAVAFFGFHALQARAHALHYTDDLAFWRATVVASPRSAKARLNYAVMVGARGELAERLRHGAEALRLAPKWPMAQIYQGDTLCRMGQTDAAWRYYERGFVLDPNGQSLIALALQCLWDKGVLPKHQERLLELADAHPGSWLAFLATDIVDHGSEHKGVDPKYRPRGYNQGPRE